MDDIREFLGKYILENVVLVEDDANYSWCFTLNGTVYLNINQLCYELISIFGFDFGIVLQCLEDWADERHPRFRKEYVKILNQYTIRLKLDGWEIINNRGNSTAISEIISRLSLVNRYFKYGDSINLLDSIVDDWAYSTKALHLKKNHYH